jgi:AhpD family alkylhydroperoxidase
MFLLKEINELYNSFSDKVYEENALDKKVKELIALACSVMADCAPCIDWHYKKAVAAGASKEEIAEALAISMSICSGSKRAKYSELISKLGQDKN